MTLEQRAAWMLLAWLIAAAGSLGAWWAGTALAAVAACSLLIEED
jgi:hypothetical protein